MLNYQKIEQAIMREENAGGFAQLMKEFIQLGVVSYDYLVAEGLYRYRDADSFVELTMNGVPANVATHGAADKIKQAVLKAQAGQITFEKFCVLAGQAGISYWTSDLQEKTVTYYDMKNIALLVEPIPGI
ncbi:MAG: DUF1398 family protein [Enterococcus sp.]